jgi:spore coat protein H
VIGSQEQREALSIHHPWQGERRFLDRVFKVEAFKKLYLAKLDEFSKTIFQPERLAAQVDEIAAAIRPAIEEESAEKLAQFNKVVAGESIRRATFPGAPEVKPIKTFVKARAESVVDQLAGKSNGKKLDDGLQPGPPGGFGPGGFLGRIFVKDFDADKNAGLTRDEFTQGFAKWFEKWNSDQSGTLTEEQLRAGINKDLEPSRGARPGAPGFGPPPGAPPPAP